MKRRVVIVTGAAGFLGSAITVDLDRDHHVVAVDNRAPNAALLKSAPGASWQQVDVADAEAVTSVFRQTRDAFGSIDVVAHFAAFYHFGTDWRREYETTNVQGTANVLQSAADSGVRRAIFASSIAAMLPPPPGEALTEKTPTADFIPYAKSKAMGEQMVLEASDRLPGIVLRIGGAFSDWCELPPLCSLIELWAGRSPLRRLVVGRGRTGMPYVHRDDVVRIVRRCVDAHEVPSSYEVFLASQQGAVTHNDVFTVIRGAESGSAKPVPIVVRPSVAAFGLYARRAIGRLTGKMPYERPWMLEYVDRPWVVDNTYTCKTLRWNCQEGKGLLDRLPTILGHFKQADHTWEHRNRTRNEGRYDYHD